MAYITPADLAVHYAALEIEQLADRDSDGVADAGVVQSAIDRAAAEIDSYLAQCYPLPLVPAAGVLAIDAWVLKMLEEWNGRIARYLLWDDTRRNSDGDTHKPEPRLRYEDIVKRLTGLAAGGCVLLGASVLKTRDTSQTPVAQMVMVGDRGRDFGRAQWGAERGQDAAFDGMSGWRGN